ncbi:hypothetical protein B0H13DRAFT_1904058 [Mycena leptocephala]|nr:hypothetical protein B0H13DRAFT_1904058 [Mycena leptocephala]
MRQVNNANLVCESGWVKTDAAVRAEAVLVSEAQRSALRCRINLQLPWSGYHDSLNWDEYVLETSTPMRNGSRVGLVRGGVQLILYQCALRTGPRARLLIPSRSSVSKAQAREKRVYRSGRCSALRGGAFQCTACCRDCAGYNATRRAVSTARSSNWSRTVCAGAYTSVPGKMEAGKLAENGEAGPPALEEAWKLQSQSKRSKAIE